MVLLFFFMIKTSLLLSLLVFYVLISNGNSTTTSTRGCCETQQEFKFWFMTWNCLTYDKSLKYEKQSFNDHFFFACCISIESIFSLNTKLKYDLLVFFLHKLRRIIKLVFSLLKVYGRIFMGFIQILAATLFPRCAILWFVFFFYFLQIQCQGSCTLTKKKKK